MYNNEELLKHYTQAWGIAEDKVKSILAVCSALKKDPEVYWEETAKQTYQKLESQDNVIKHRTKVKTGTASFIFEEYKRLGTANAGDVFELIRSKKQDLTPGNFQGRQSELVSAGILDLVEENTYRVNSAFKNKTWDQAFYVYFKYKQEAEELASLFNAPNKALELILHPHSNLSPGQKESLVKAVSELLKESLITSDKLTIYRKIKKLIG